MLVVAWSTSLLNHKKSGSTELTHDSGFHGPLRPDVGEAILEVSTRKPAPVTWPC
jgi:hypothetical protein